MIHVGDCLSVLANRYAEFEAVVSDPPSGIAFMGLKFDLDQGGEDKWIAYMAERFAVEREACIPGAYGLFWALPRTQDWTMQALRRAGWRITDVVQHVFGQGWPKGKGQLKPAQEGWILCRDPRGKVRPLGIDGCRVRRSWAERPESWFRSGHSAKPEAAKIAAPPGVGIKVDDGGSWPPDAVFSHCPCCREVGSRKVASGVAVQRTGKAGKGHLYRERDGLPIGTPDASYGVDGTETLPAFECLAACSCGLSGLSPAGGAPERCPGCGEERWWACPVADLDAQSDGGSRFFPTFQSASSCAYCPVCLDASLRGDTSTRGMGGGIGSGASPRAENFISSLNTDGFGSEPTGQFRPVTRSTTRTRIRPTTGSRISSASPPTSTTQSTPSACPTCGAPMVAWSAAAASAIDGSRWPTTTPDPRAPITDTASLAAQRLSANGEVRTSNTEKPTGEPGEPWGYRPSFRYDAKASARERQAGCEHLFWIRDKDAPIGWRRVTAEEHAAAPEKDRAQGNVHATIKPIGA